MCASVCGCGCGCGCVCVRECVCVCVCVCAVHYVSLLKCAWECAYASSMQDMHIVYMYERLYPCVRERERGSVCAHAREREERERESARKCDLQFGCVCFCVNVSCAWLQSVYAS